MRGVAIIELQINNSHGALPKTMDNLIFCLHYLTDSPAFKILAEDSNTKSLAYMASEISQFAANFLAPILIGVSGLMRCVTLPRVNLPSRASEPEKHQQSPGRGFGNGCESKIAVGLREAPLVAAGIHESPDAACDSKDSCAIGTSEIHRVEVAGLAGKGEEREVLAGAKECTAHIDCEVSAVSESPSDIDAIVLCATGGAVEFHRGLGGGTEREAAPEA